MAENRTLENSFRVVTLAKLDPASLMPRSQALSFANQDNETTLTLMEVTPEVADQLQSKEISAHYAKGIKNLVSYRQRICVQR